MKSLIAWHSELIETAEGFHALEPDYCALLERSSAENIFLTWEWLSTWMDVYGAGAAPFVILVRDDRDRIVAVAPLRIAWRRRFGLWYRQLGFIGTGESVCPEFLDIVAVPGNEQMVVTVIGEAIVRYRSRWDKLILTDIPGDSRRAGQLITWLRQHRLQALMEPDRVCPFISLPGTWDQCEAVLGRSFKRHLRRDRRRLISELGATFEVVTPSEDAEIKEIMDDVARLHQDRMEDTQRGGNFRKLDYRAFHESLARRFAGKGWLLVAFLRLDGKRIAARYGYVYGGTYYAYQSGFDSDYQQHAPGKVLLSCLVRHFIDIGLNEFNFLRGAQPHKYEWTASDRRTFKLTSWSRNRRGVILFVLDKLFAAARGLKRLGVIGRILQAIRRLLRREVRFEHALCLY
jgi:CelD/BcsL family acetyltransferase involved in cellulose biosynthesis